MFQNLAYAATCGLRVRRSSTDIPVHGALDRILDALDTQRGALLGSSYEFPGRYKRWSLGFIDPPVELTLRGDAFRLCALNDRGRVVIAALGPALADPHLETTATADAISGTVRRSDAVFDEAQRTRQPSPFSVVRAVTKAMEGFADKHLGLYGAFGYDLIFSMEPIALERARPDDQRDLVAFIPDSLVILDHQLQRAVRLDWEFEFNGRSTHGMPRNGDSFDPHGKRLTPERRGDFAPGGYADLVREALPYFGRGDLFEVVPSQSFYEATEATPAQLFRTLRQVNPSPYGFLFNLGGEYLVGASPEMFVRVEGRRVETCPISGTIRRGRDAIEDSDQILKLLNSAKDEAELTMCTDVDRNDKSRVCVPGSVRVIGRRQIEMYSHLIHTVDHVEGELEEGYDALDAFLSHTWAVTVTGAPKPAAIKFIEKRERSSRRWYGGAVGFVGFDGDLNTGLTLRTIRLKDGIAEIRVGATLLSDSIPEEEEAETHTKAAALFRTLELARQGAMPPARAAATLPPRIAEGRRVLLVDCEDSFVHTLASYFRATGAAVSVLRHHAAPAALDQGWDLVVLSPGPGRPEQFGVPAIARRCIEAGTPLFGVCLGLQGIVEALGGALDQMPAPQHGKFGNAEVRRPSRLFEGLPDRFPIGRYHSLCARPATLPQDLSATAVSQDGVIMAVEHRSLPVAAVQFHPESIMTAADDLGHRIVGNVMAKLAGAGRKLAAE